MGKCVKDLGFLPRPGESRVKVISIYTGPHYVTPLSSKSTLF